ncbi:penicillin-binding protein 1C [Escherichia coli]|uniref:Penicillin-binding protein 1C n=1 Tax=Escherichia coli TaxID=562 RepID=A0A377CZ45_ECOLX|nr:penicillin-binding protein 1C [Escherichia coli]
MDRNGLRQNYAMLDCRCICPTALRRIFRSFSAALVQKLEDMAAAYTAFARHGKAGKLRLQPDDPLLERL